MMITLIQLTLMFHFVNCAFSSAVDRNKTMFLVYGVGILFVTFWMMYV
jgi:hypothetical protein